MTGSRILAAVAWCALWGGLLLLERMARVAAAVTADGGAYHPGCRAAMGLTKAPAGGTGVRLRALLGV